MKLKMEELIVCERRDEGVECSLLLLGELFCFSLPVYVGAVSFLSTVEDIGYGSLPARELRGKEDI